jgi:hypothetical protein
MNIRKPMAMSQSDLDALTKGGAHTVEFEMTEERKQKFSRVSNKIVELLRANCDTPPEAYMLLCFIMDGFESCYGVKGGIILDHEDTKQKD